MKVNNTTLLFCLFIWGYIASTYIFGIKSFNVVDNSDYVNSTPSQPEDKPIIVNDDYSNKVIKYDDSKYVELETAPRHDDIMELTNYLTHNYDSQEDKVRIIFLWIMKNIDYTKMDLKSQEFANFYTGNNYFHTSWDYVYHKNRNNAICQSYAELFSKMLDVINVKNAVIGGLGFPEGNNYEDKEQVIQALTEFTENQNNYNKGKIDRNSYVENWNELSDSFGGVGHTWNVVYFNNKPYLFDTTWSDEGGFNYNNNWYKVTPKKFLKTHYPQNVNEQFLSKPLSPREFVDNMN